MKNKKVYLIIFLIIILILGIFIYKYFKNRTKGDLQGILEEYVPEEEITKEQTRETIVSLYFVNSESNQLTPEARLVDSKELLVNPYEKIVNLLIDGPKNDKLRNPIPDGTKLISAEINSDCVRVNLSKEFVENHQGGVEQEKNTIYSIVNTLTELNEVNSVKILIEGEEGREFKDGLINFKESFLRVSN